jgi:putative hydrolase of the HAD superfamily
MKVSRSQMAQLEQLQAVVFDLGGVIATSLEPALRDLVDTYGGETAISSATLHAVWRPLYRDASLGLLHPDQLWHGLRQEIALHGLPPGEEDQALLSRIQMREPSIPQTIVSLRSSYRVGLLSNYVERWALALLQRFAVMPLFDAVLISSQLGMRKPEALIYWRACEELGVSPSRAAYIGDEEEDMIGAQAVGMLPLFIPGEDRKSSVGLTIDRIADVLTLLKSVASA